MPNPVKWITNVGKSISYSFIDEMKELNPALASFKEDNGDFVKSVKNTISIKSIKDSSKNLSSNEYFSIAKDTINNLKSDIKTGNLYNRERDKKAEDQFASKMMGFDDSDFGFDDSGDMNFNFDEDVTDSIDQSTKSTNDMVDLVGKKTSLAISNAVVGSSEYMAKTSRKNTKILFDQNNILFSKLHSDLGTVNQNIGSILEFNKEATTTHYNNSAAYYSNMTSKMEETTSMLKEMLEMQKEYYGKKNDFNGIYGSNERSYSGISNKGVINLEAFFKNIKGNVKDKLSMLDMLGSMVTDTGMGGMLSASPGKYLTQGLVKMLTPKMLKESMKDFNETLSGVLANAILKINDEAGDFSFKQILASLFKTNESLKTEINPSGYKKDAIPFDGVTKKAITEVIPTYLAKILSAVSNQSETRYDYEKGRFVSMDEIKREYQNIVKNNSKMASWNMSNSMMDLANNTIKFDKDDKGNFISKKQFQKDLEAFFEYQYKNAKVFNGRKENIDPATYGMKGGQKSEISAKLIKQMWNALPNKERMKLAGEILDQRQMQNTTMRDIESNSNSSIINLFNGSGATKTGSAFKSKKTSSDSPYANSSKYSGAIIDILGDIRKEVSYIRAYGIGEKNGFGGKSKGKHSKKKSRTTNNYNRTVSFENYNPYDDININDFDEDENYSSMDLSFMNENLVGPDGKVLPPLEKKDNETQEEFDQRVRERFEQIKSGKKKNKGIFGKIADATSGNKLVKSIAGGIDKILEKPAQFLTTVIRKADETVFDLVFGKAGDKENKGILYEMKVGIRKTFTNMGDWLQKNVLDPIKEKFTAKNIKEMGRKFFGLFGIDIDKTVKSVREKLFGVKGEDGKRQDGKKGIFGQFIDDTKDSFKKAFGWFKGTFKEAAEWAGFKGTLNEKGKTKQKKKDIAQDVMRRAMNNEDKRAAQRVHEKNKEKKEEDKRRRTGEEILGQAAAGLRRVPKTGVYALSEGEAVIPPDHDPAKIKRRYANEARAIDRYKKHGGISMFAEGTEGPSEDDKDTNKKDKKSNYDRAKEIYDSIKFEYDDYEEGQAPLGMEIMKQLSNLLKLGKAFAGDVSDKVMSQKDADNKVKEDVSNIFGKVMNLAPEVKNALPNMTVGAVIGSGVSLISGMIGGPLLGAAVGAASGLVIKSKTVQDLLFGSTDKDGNYKAGLIPKNVSDTIKKYVPTMAKGSTLGMITSLIPFVPGGPMAGILLGSAAGVVAKNEKIYNALFGEDSILPDFPNRIKKALPKMGAGAAVGLVAGPFGVATNILLGSAVGFAADSDKFKNVFFGEKDKYGKRVGGIYNTIVDTISAPIKDMTQKFGDWFNETIKRNLNDFFTPLKNSALHAVDTIKDFFKDKINDKIVRPIEEKLKSLLKPFAKLFGFAFNTGKNILKTGIGLPFNMLGGIGRRMTRHQVKNGRAYDMTAAERNEYRRTHKLGIIGRDKASRMDQTLEQMGSEDLQSAKDAIEFLRTGDRDNKKVINENTKKIQNSINANIGKLPAKQQKDIIKYLNKGKYKQAIGYLDKINISDPSAKSALIKDIEASGKEIAKARYAMNYNKNGEYRTKAEDKLKSLGFDTNSLNLRDMSRLLDTELADRNNSDAYEESKKSENFQNDILKDIQEIILQMKMLNKGLLGSDIDVESITTKNLDKKIKKAQDKAEKRNEQQEHIDRGEARTKFGRARQKIFGGIKGAVGHTFNRLGGWVFADNTTEDGNVVDRAAYKGVKAAETLGRGVINSPRRAKRAVAKWAGRKLNKFKGRNDRLRRFMDEYFDDHDVDGQAAEGLYGVPYSGLYALSEGEYVIPSLAEGTELPTNRKNNTIVLRIMMVGDKLRASLGMGKGKKIRRNKNKDENSYQGDNNEKTTTSFYNGLPIKNKVDANGNVEPDTSDAETVNTLRERDEDRANQKGIFDTIKGIPSKIGEIFGIGKKKDKKKDNLLGKILKAAGIAMLAAFFAPKIINFIKKTVAPFIEDTVVPVFKEKILPAIEEKLNDVKNGFMKGFLGDSYTGDEPEGVVGAFGEKIGEGVAATKSYMEETVLPWITNTAIPAIGNMLGEVLPQILANAIQNLPKTLGFLGKTGLKTMDILLGNGNNAGGTTTINPNQLQSGETGMYDENGNVLTAEDIQNGNYKKIYNSQGVEGTVEDGQIKFKDQSMVGGTTFKKIGNGMGHAFAHGKQGVMNKLLGKSSNVLKHLGIGGKAASVATKVISKPIELAGKAGAKVSKGFDKFISKATSSAAGETVEHVTGDVIENTTGKVLATAAETSGKQGGKVAKILSGLITKLKDGVEKLFSNSKVVAKLSKLAETLGIKSVANWVKGFKASVTEIFENALKKGTSKVGSSILKKAAGKLNIILTVATLVLDFLTGCDQAESILGVTDTTIVEEVVAGLINALCNLLIIPSIIPGVNWIAQKLFGVLGKDLSQRQAEADKEYQEYINQTGSTETKEEYLKKKYSVTGKVGSFVSNIGKNVKETVSKAGTAIKNVIGKDPISGTVDVVKNLYGFVFKGDVKGLVTYKPNEDNSLLGFVGNYLTTMAKSMFIAPTAVSWVLHNTIGKLGNITGFAKDTASATFDTFKTYGSSVINGDLKGLLSYQPTDGDTILGKAGNLAANVGKIGYIVPTAISSVIHGVVGHIDDIVGFGKDTIIAGGETVDTYIDSVKSGDLKGLLAYQPTDGDTILGKVGNFTANLGKTMFIVPTAISAVVHKAVDKIEGAIDKIKSIKTEDTEKAVEQAKDGKISVFSAQYWKTGETDDGIFGRLQTVFGTMYKAINLPFILIKSTIGKIVDKITNIKDWITGKFAGIKSFFKDPVGFIKDKVMGDEKEAEGSETRTSSSNEEHGGTEGSFARGGTVSRSGLYALSKGELVIPRLAEGTTDNSLSSDVQNASKSYSDNIKENVIHNSVGKAMDYVTHTNISDVASGVQNYGDAISSQTLSKVYSKISGLITGLLQDDTVVGTIFKLFNIAGDIQDKVKAKINGAATRLVAKICDKLTEKLTGAAATRFAGYITSFLSGGGVFTIASLVKYFIYGMYNTAEIAKILPEDANNQITIVCGLFNAINNLLPTGIIDTDIIFDLCMDALSQIVGNDVLNLNKLRSKANDKIAQYGDNYTLDQYISKYKSDNTEYQAAALNASISGMSGDKATQYINNIVSGDNQFKTNDTNEQTKDSTMDANIKANAEAMGMTPEEYVKAYNISSYAAGGDIRRDGLYALSKGEYVASNIKNSVFNTANTVKNKLVSGINGFNPFNIIQDKLADMFISSITNKLQSTGKGNSSLIENHLQDIYSYAISGNDKFFKSESDNDSGTLKLIGMMGRAMFNPIYSVQKMQKFFIGKVSDQLGDGDKVLETFNNQLEETNNYLSGKGSMKNYWNDKFDDDKSMLGTIGKTITTIYKTLQYPMVLAKSLFQTTSGMSSNDTESVDAVSGDNTSATTDATSTSDMNAASDSSASTTVSSTSTDTDKAQNAINKATKKVKDKSKKLTYKNPLNKYAFVSDVKSKSNKKNMPDKYYRLVGLYGENRVRAQKNNSGRYVYLVKLTDGKWYDYDKLGTKKSGRGSGLYVGSGSYDPEPISEKSITGNNHPKMPFYTFKSPKTIEDFDDKPVVADQSKITPVSKNFVSQITGNISTERFNVSADTSRQTVSDSGCAPAVATMVINSLAGQSTIDMNTAVQDALGYKVPNSGVTSEYFDDEFNKYGISTQYIENDSSDPKDSAIVKAIKEKRPTILLGRDPNNKSKNNSPFGSNPHYVVADSISKDNQYIYINDPESRKPKTKYNLKNVLPRVTIGITTSIGRKARNAASKLNTYVGRATRQMVKPKNGDYISKYIHHFESGSDGPTAIGHCGNDGGLSFGSYQMIWDGPAPEFWSKYFASKYGSPTSCDDLKTKWLKAVNDIGKDAFFAKEWDYILNSDYLGLVNNIKSKYGFDPDQYSRAMQDCCWSWAVHRGVGGATKEFGEVASQFNNKPMDADETKLLNACYDVRASHMTGQWHQSIGIGRYGTGADTERTILLGIVGQDPIDHTAPDGTAGAVVGSDDTSSDSGSSNNSSKKSILDVLLAPFDLLASDYGLTGSDGDDSSSGGTTEYNANGISGTVSSDKNIADKQVKVVAQMNSVYGKLKYAQDNAKYPGSRNPDDGSGDCSSTVEWAYKKALGVEVGGWSGEQATYDTTYTVDGGSTAGVTTDESKLQLGDILLYGSEAGSHAEMYFGHGQVLTHGNPDKLGPTTAAINRRADYWGARRLKDFKSSGTSTFNGNNSSSSNSTSSSSSSTSSSNDSKSSKKKNKGSGSGLFAGRGSFVSQLDPKYANRAFNIKGDTIKQTIGDSGCAPAAATMVLNDIAGRASMMDSSKLALKYKGSNDGVTADYFSDIYSRNGLDTNYYNNSDQVRSDLRRGKDVVLLGSDKSNTSKSNSPFGPNSHYVVASGMSKDGRNITIKDPEAKKPKKYNADKILGHTKLGIGYGSGLASKFTKKLKKYIGRGFGSYSGILYVGDSRTEMMADCIHEDGVSFIAKVSQGLAWLKSTAGPEMEARIKSDPNLAVVINMGVNDIYQPDNYIAYYTELKKRNPNAHLFYMSVNPVDNDPNCSDAEVQGFNSKMQSFWGSNYLDVYSYLKSDGYKTTDGTHYDDATSKKIHEKVKSMLSGTSSSTSGSSSSSSDSSNNSVLDRLLGSMDNLAEKYGLVVNVGGSDSSSSDSTSTSGSTTGSDYPKYNLTEDQVTEIATGVTGETGGDNLFESMQEASQMANLNEVTKKRQATGADMLSTLHSGWYASASFTRGVTDTAKDAVRKVFNEGKRTLPRYVTEHDTFPMDITNAKDRSAYQKGDPVSNRYGSNYKFYDFFGQNKEGDISGYFDQDYATYQNDVPWSGTGSGLLNNYPKYKGRGGFNDVMTAFSNYTDQMASSMGLTDSNDGTESVSDSTKFITKKSDGTSDMTKLMKSVIKLLAKVADNTSDISEIVSILSKLVDLQSTQMNNSETKQKWTSLKTDLANKLSSYNKTSTGSGELSNLMNSIESLAME